MKNGFRPAVDRLDARRLLAANITATLSRGVLTIKGTAGADVIDVNVSPQPKGMITIDGVRKSFQAAKVKQINVLGGAGDDSIDVQTNGRPRLAVRINGGAGNNVINGVPDFPVVVPVATPVAATIATETLGGVNLAGNPGPAGSTTPTPAPTTPTTPAPPVATTPAPTSIAAEVQRIVDLTNAQRVQAGLAALAVDPQLMAMANVQSTNMARLDVMSHDLPGTNAPTLADRAALVGYNFSTLGENIAYNYANADAVVAGWMNSPGHRANILNPSFTQIGVSVAFDATGEPYYTQEFGKPMA